MNWHRNTLHATILTIQRRATTDPQKKGNNNQILRDYKIRSRISGGLLFVLHHGFVAKSKSIENEQEEEKKSTDCEFMRRRLIQNNNNNNATRRKK